MRKIICLTLFTAALLVVPALQTPAQTKADLIQSQSVEKKAIAEYSAKNYSGFLENMLEANKLRPNHPRLLYNLADAYALNGKPADALAALQRLAAMGLYFQVEKDDDFKSLFDTEAWPSVL